MIRITLGDLRRITQGIPDNAILCCQSDEEGNSTSTCLDVYVDRVGRKESVKYGDKVYDFTTGDDIEGIDLDKDLDRTIVIFRPSL